MSTKMPEASELFSNDATNPAMEVPDDLLSNRPMSDPEPEAEKEAGDENVEKKQQDFMRREEKVISMAIPEWPAELPTICDVPEDLTEGNKGAYTPKVVCIGPLFDSERARASMVRLEQYKRCCVRKLIFVAAGSLKSAAWSPKVHGLLLGNCFDTMMHLVPRIRAAYSSIGDTKSNNGNEQPLANKMLIDGCFLLHRLLKHARRSSSSSSSSSSSHVDDDDWIQLLGRCWVWGTVTRDLLLLSNQVPFFVIQKLLEQLRLSGGDNNILVTGGLQLFSSLHPRPLHAAPIPCGDVHHLLHLFYLSIDLPPRHSTSKELLPQAELTWWVPCAKELEEAGVRIRPRKYGAKSFLDIRFRRRRGILEIPPLQLFDYSEPLFRNLIAFEQTYPKTAGHITTYAIFMDCLLKTPEDARLLHHSGVLLNHINGQRDDAASMDFFSRLCAEAHTSADRNYLAGVMDQVVKYQNGRCPRWRADLVRNYFTNPWVTTSVVAAVVLLVLAVLQTFYAVYAYYKPPSPSN